MRYRGLSTSIKDESQFDGSYTQNDALHENTACSITYSGMCVLKAKVMKSCLGKRETTNTTTTWL
jgi:hypothetical protein